MRPKAFPHRCTIQDLTAGATDASGFAAETFGNTYTNVRCRFYGVQQGRETLQDKEALVADYMLNVLPDQAIDEQMRVASVVDVEGTAIPPDGTYEVTSVRSSTRARGKLSHQIVYLKLVR